VFFFDEAHLLFDNAPPALVAKVEQVVRLVRSKGVGVWFVTQNPLDLPDPVLGQLGNRVQHALRAFTPRDQKAVRAAATTFRPEPALDTETVITELGVGEALVSMLEDARRAGHGAALPGAAAVLAHRPDHDEERATGARPQPGRRPVRPVREPRVGLRDPGGARRAGGGRRRATAADTPGRAESGRACTRGARAAKPRASNRQGYVEAATKSAVRSMSSHAGPVARPVAAARHARLADPQVKTGR
jgi:uncharacterized protein